MGNDMRPILIGMNNPISLVPGHELYPLPVGCTGHRIYEMLRTNTCRDIRRREYLNAFERRNLVVAHNFIPPVAKIRAQQMYEELFFTHRTVVLLGNEVRDAFKFAGIPPLLIEPQEVGGIVWRQIPHPSGRNLWYNDENNCRKVGAMLAQLYEESIK